MVAINPKQAFSSRLHQMCADAGMPVRGRAVALAKLADVSKEAARKWLNGEAIPAMDHVVIIAQHYAVSADWLLTGKKQPEIGAAGALTDEEIKHIERLRCLPPDERARAFRVIEAMVPQTLRHVDAA